MRSAIAAASVPRTMSPLGSFTVSFEPGASFATRTCANTGFSPCPRYRFSHPVNV